ncbi:putative nucleotidyltransferase substrate binding domain-containing protein [Actinomycetes bacterium M1A6_2h]
MSDTAEFLGRHPPFQALTESELSELADAASTHTYRTGDTIAGSGVDDVDAVWMVRSGAVALLHPDDAEGAAPIDTVTAGGLFGFSAMLSGTRATFVARATSDAVILRLPGPSARPYFARPAGTRYLAGVISASFGGHAVGVPALGRPGSVMGRSDNGSVGMLVRPEPVTAVPGTSIRDAVCTMTELGTSYVVIPLPHGRFGIFTDRDLRTRVVAAGVPVDAPVEQVMSAPARTVDADRTPAGVLMEMLELGVRHMVVVDVRGGLVGVVENSDLLSDSTAQSFSLRRRIAMSTSADALADACTGIGPLSIDMHSTGTAVSAASGILSVVVDAAVRRAVEIALLDHGQVEPIHARDVAWLSLGSIGRREAMPSSDVDSALSWADHLGGRAGELRAFAADVHRTLDACGLPADTNNAVASSARFSRSSRDWRVAARGWLNDPLGDRGIIMSSLLVDGRVVWGNPELHTVPESYRSMAVDFPDALRLQLREALATRARVRSLRDVLARRGNTVDLKTHAVAPIVNLARWGGLSVGVASASTPARLHAAAGNGMIGAEDARVLTEVFDLLQRLRFAHQVNQLEQSHPPGDVVVLTELTPLERSVLMDAIREIASVQKRVGYIASNSGVPIGGIPGGS